MSGFGRQPVRNWARFLEAAIDQTKDGSLSWRWDRSAQPHGLVAKGTIISPRRESSLIIKRVGGDIELTVVTGISQQHLIMRQLRFSPKVRGLMSELLDESKKKGRG